MKVSKKICSIIMSVLMIVSMLVPISGVTVSAATVPTLLAESVTAESATEVSIAVKITNSSGVYNGNFTLQYDNSKLEAVSYSYGNIFNEHTRNCNLNYQSTGNQIRFTFSGAYALTGDGTLITFTFNVKENVFGNAALNFTAYKMYDENGLSLSPTATNGHISIAEKVIENPSLSVIGGTVNAGEIISVPVKISNTDSVYNGNFTLQYDSSLLTAESYTYGSIFDEHTKNCNLNYQSTGDQIRFTFSGAYPLTGDGTLVTFTFKANENVSGNAALNFTAYKMYDENGISLSPTAVNGGIEVSENSSNIITGQCGADVHYSLNLDTGILTITGQGDMWDWKAESTPWWSFKENIISVKIENGVTNVGNFAFAGLISLIDVYLPDSISNIGISTFANCNSLENIELPTNIKSIDKAAFYNCKSLRNLILPNGIETLGENVFGNCINFTEFVLPNSITSTGGYLFQNCTNLREVTFSQNMNTISERTFFGCTGLQEIEIPYNITNIDSLAFENCSNLEYVQLSDGVINIKSGAFLNCSSLENITIPDSVTSIGSTAFKNCTSLCEVTIGTNVKGIGNSAFQGCIGIKNIIIPNCVEIISDNAFSGCTGLKNIIIPNSVIDLGSHVFEGCSNLSSVLIGENIKKLDSYVFSECSELTEVIIPNSVELINPYAFNECESLTKIVIPENVRKVSNGAFYDCCNLESATVLNSQMIFYLSVFTNCNKLTIYGYENSTAESYANDYSVPFVALDSVKLSSISVYSEPTKQTYYAGDYLDTKGLQLKLTYSDGSSEIVSSGYTTNLDGVSLGPGTKNVIVTYQGLTTTFAINVQNISGTITPSSLDLIVGDTYTLTFSLQAPEDAILTWVTSDNSVVTVSNGVVRAVGIGTAKVYIRINNNGFATTSQTCTVTVTDESEPIVLSSISISNMPTKTVYEIGELLNTTGLKLKLTYSDGSTETITSGYTVSGFDSSTAGTKTVTVKYGDLSTKFTVTVNVAEVDGPRVSVESKKASAGSTVLITVCLEENPGIWGMDLVVNYDKTQLTLTNVINGTVFSDSEWTPGNLSGNKYILSYEASGFDDITANGILATLEFTVNENATVDSFSSISLSYNVGDVINVNFDDINLAVVSGGINITDFIYGDLNGDGLVNKKDSLLMKMYLADNTTVIDMQAADVYADGSINKKDSLYLKQYLAGLDVELGV